MRRELIMPAGLYPAVLGLTCPAAVPLSMIASEKLCRGPTEVKCYLGNRDPKNPVIRSYRFPRFKSRDSNTWNTTVLHPQTDWTLDVESCKPRTVLQSKGTANNIANASGAPCIKEVAVLT